MTVLHNDHKERSCDAHSVNSGSTTFSNEQPIYSVPTVITATTPSRMQTDNDKQSIISCSSSDSKESSGRKKHSIFPNIKKFIQYNVFENEKDTSGEIDNATTLFVQKWLDAIGALDLVLFVVSIILAISTEKYLCYDGPVRLDYSRNVFLNNSTLSEEAANNTLYSLTAYEYVKEYLLKRMMYDSQPMYHFVVIVLLAIGMSYIVTEIWLFCVLIKIGREKQPTSYCLKWILWRSIILTITLFITFFDVISSHQVTCSEVIIVPFQVVRMFIGGVPVVWVLCNKSNSGGGSGYF